MTNLDEPSNELQNKIMDYIQKSGFPLELQVRSQIMKANETLPNFYGNQDVEHHITYIDPEDSKLRKTDVTWWVPSWHKNEPHINFSFYFECKSSEKYSWVFFTEPAPSHQSWYSNSANFEGLKILPDLFSTPVKVIGKPIFYGHTSKIAYSSLTYPENSPDNVRSAVFQAIKPAIVDAQSYLDDLISEGKEFIEVATLLFPVIVYSGYLFEYEYTPTGSHFSPTNHVVLKVEHSIQNHRFTFFVDIVRADYLPEYLRMRVIDMVNVCNFVGQEQPPIQEVRF